jgi:hypothetical protein
MRASLPAAVAASLAAAITASLAAPRPAAAQAAVLHAAALHATAKSDVRRPDAPAAAALVRTAATFRLARRDAVGLPAEFTVGDSAGHIVARYRLDGERAPAAWWSR